MFDSALLPVYGYIGLLHYTFKLSTILFLPVYAHEIIYNVELKPNGIKLDRIYMHSYALVLRMQVKHSTYIIIIVACIRLDSAVSA